METGKSPELSHESAGVTVNTRSEFISFLRAAESLGLDEKAIRTAHALKHRDNCLNGLVGLQMSQSLGMDMITPEQARDEFSGGLQVDLELGNLPADVTEQFTSLLAAILATPLTNADETTQAINTFRLKSWEIFEQAKERPEIADALAYYHTHEEAISDARARLMSVDKKNSK
jgi:hypothetical protein